MRRRWSVLAVVVSAFIWVVGEAFGGVFTGDGTDPSSGLLLAFLALAYWPGLAARDRREPALTRGR